MDIIQQDILRYLRKEMTETELQAFDIRLRNDATLREQTEDMTLIMLINEHPDNPYSTTTPVSDETRRFVENALQTPPPSGFNWRFLLPILAVFVIGVGAGFVKYYTATQQSIPEIPEISVPAIDTLKTEPAPVHQIVPSAPQTVPPAKPEISPIASVALQKALTNELGTHTALVAEKAQLATENTKIEGDLDDNDCTCYQKTASGAAITIQKDTTFSWLKTNMKRLVEKTTAAALKAVKATNEQLRTEIAAEKARLEKNKQCTKECIK